VKKVILAISIILILICGSATAIFGTWLGTYDVTYSGQSFSGSVNILEYYLYRIELNAGEQFTANLDVISGDADLYSYDSGLNSISCYSSNVGDDSITCTVDATGTYYVQVFGATDGASQYTLTITYTGTQPTVTPAPTPIVETISTDGTPIRGTLQLGSYADYRFDCLNNHVYTVTVTVTDPDPNLYIKDPSGIQITSSRNTGYTTETATFVSIYDSGYCTARVIAEGEAYGDASYTIRVEDVTGTISITPTPPTIISTPTPTPIGVAPTEEKSPFEGVTDWMWNNIVKPFVIDPITSVINTITKGITDALTTVFDTIIGALQTIGNAILEPLRIIYNAITEALNTIFFGGE